MTYIVDTNIFLRTLIKEDEKVFHDCIEFLKLVKTNKIEAVIPGVVLSEIVWTLKSFYKFPKEKVIQSLDSILKLSGLKVVDNYNYERTLKLYKNKNVKYIDCLIASLATDKNYTVVSYDKDFKKLKNKNLEPGSKKIIRSS